MLNDPVSCLLCLDAHERSAMLRVQLRPIGIDGGREYWFCKICGGAIAAEYLFRERENKSDRVEVVDNFPNPNHEESGNVEIPSSVVLAATDASGAAAAASGETQTVELEPRAIEEPTTGHKKGRKGANN
jgi:hypothetical protein